MMRSVPGVDPTEMGDGTGVGGFCLGFDASSSVPVRAVRNLSAAAERSKIGGRWVLSSSSEMTMISVWKVSNKFWWWVGGARWVLVWVKPQNGVFLNCSC